MKDIVNEYKNLSYKILDVFKNEDVSNYELDKYLSQRDILIKSISEEKKLDEFRNIYSKELYEIDKDIKKLLQDNINKVKEEIKEYKKSQNVNFAYANMNKLNLNIFSKKV